MDLTNAYWEERNTGFKTCEIVFEKGDSIEDYLSAKVEDNFEYSVVKIPTENLKLLHFLEAIGYDFIETQFNISVDTSELDKIEKKWSRVIEGTDYQKVNSKQDLDLIISNVSNGMFKSDRISLDDKLGKETSPKRYVNWIKDLYKDNDTEIFYLTKQENKTGFFIIHNCSGKSLQSLIAGIFNEYQGQGLSVVLIYYYLKLAAEKNVKRVFTSFSSNNLGMLNTFTKTVLFRTSGLYYVLRRLIELKK